MGKVLCSLPVIPRGFSQNLSPWQLTDQWEKWVKKQKDTKERSIIEVLGVGVEEELTLPGSRKAERMEVRLHEQVGFTKQANQEKGNVSYFLDSWDPQNLFPKHSVCSNSLLV